MGGSVIGFGLRPGIEDAVRFPSLQWQGRALNCAALAVIHGKKKSNSSVNRNCLPDARVAVEAGGLGAEPRQRNEVKQYIASRGSLATGRLWAHLG